MEEQKNLVQKTPAQDVKEDVLTEEEPDSDDSSAWWLFGLIFAGSAAYALATKNKTS